ncbi:hypothetical protein CYMTET_56449 [Cymbomonas tetramitiformis]|uniref:Uncharacterized protein n=1 Tax=Cymbomonas tetramitiformis TaxID=36881 RepID=A0AAE0ELT9_9CHLO|nr:hypothetical protein CYMTET_56449 [Cymbomonas tetramitiformis]
MGLASPPGEARDKLASPSPATPTMQEDLLQQILEMQKQQDALRAKLQFVEDRVYQAADGMVADEVLQQWLNDFDKSHGKAMLSATMKSAANADARVVKEHRDQRWKERKKHDDEDKKPIYRERRPPPPFGHGVSLKDATRQQQIWLEAEKERLLANRAKRTLTTSTMSDQEGELSASANKSGAAEDRPAAKTGMEALLEQQSSMMQLMMKQMETLAARVEVAEETAAKAVA